MSNADVKDRSLKRRKKITGGYIQITRDTKTKIIVTLTIKDKIKQETLCVVTIAMICSTLATL